MRDSQRSKLYAAERRAFTSDVGPRLSIDEMQALVDKWGSSKLLARRYPAASERVEVVVGRGASYHECHGFLHMGPRGMEMIPARIRIPKWGRRKWVLLHEYAHHLTQGKTSHGWEFAECFLYLVRVHMSKSAEERLRHEFRVGRVRHKRPVKRNMTDEQREAARQRMLALHARKAATRERAAA